jgi:hypothetical protein
MRSTVEASNVIAMRLQIISKGNTQGQRESELMLSEKVKAFAQAQTDMMAGVSSSIIRNNIRAVIRANEERLKGLNLAA